MGTYCKGEDVRDVRDGDGNARMGQCLRHPLRHSLVLVRLFPARGDDEHVVDADR